MLDEIDIKDYEKEIIEGKFEDIYKDLVDKTIDVVEELGKKKGYKIPKDKYDSNGNLIYDGDSNEIDEVVENTTVQGMVEVNYMNRIYMFNGQHFGESGVEMKEYTRANISDKKQECIDYYTSEKYDTSYIQDGDIIICTGDLIKYKYNMGDNVFDTKDNPIIVLKSKDYDSLKKETINSGKV